MNSFQKIYNKIILLNQFYKTFSENMTEKNKFFFFQKRFKKKKPYILQKWNLCEKMILTWYFACFFFALLFKNHVVTNLINLTSKLNFISFYNFLKSQNLPFYSLLFFLSNQEINHIYNFLFHPTVLIMQPSLYYSMVIYLQSTAVFTCNQSYSK